MAALTVWRFPTPDGADAALEQLRDLETRQQVAVRDAAVVSWESGKNKPETRQPSGSRTGGALGGGFWGLLFGLIFFVPLLGLAIGAATGALFGWLTDAGINDTFITSVRDRVTPGTSALFLLSSEAVAERVRQEFSGQPAELIAASLSSEQEARIREAFAQEE